jgi:hypothetical protein
MQPHEYAFAGYIWNLSVLQVFFTALAAVGTFGAVFVALFKEELLRRWRKPNLVVSIKNHPPDCHMGLTAGGYNCYYFRLWVRNHGNVSATNVQLFASELSYETDLKQYVPIDNFLPMNLTWAHTMEIFRSRIAPEMGRHCDLGHIADPSFQKIHGEARTDVPADRTIMSLALEQLPFNKIHLLRPGNYRLQLIVVADNAAPIKKVIEINHAGYWLNNEKEMFDERNIRIEIH